MYCASTTVTATTRVIAIAETFFGGAGVFLSAPFKSNCSTNTKKGLHEIFVHTPKNILRTVFIPIEFLEGTIEILIRPKSFTMEMAQCMNVNLKHAKAGTLHSIKHEDDLDCVQGVVKPKFMEYQERTNRCLHPDIYKNN